MEGSNNNKQPQNSNSDTSSNGSCASTLTFPGKEYFTSISIASTESQNEYIDACKCIGCWTVYPETERSPTSRSILNIEDEDTTDNARDYLLEWLSKVEEQNQMLSPSKRKIADSEPERSQEEQERGSKFKCENDRSRSTSNSSFEYQIL